MALARAIADGDELNVNPPARLLLARALGAERLTIA